MKPCLALAILLAAAPALAQNRVAESEIGTPRLARPIAEAAENEYLRSADARRRGALAALYSSLAGLNALDVYSTMAR